MTESELRQQARDNGIRWATVLEIYAELRSDARRAFGEGDWTLIPRFDEVADEVRETTEKLWDYLTRDFVRKTPRSEMLRRAMQSAEEYRGELEAVPF